MTTQTLRNTEYKVGNKKPPHPPWKPGESGNPNGRPKTSLTSILRECLEEVDGDGKTTKERIVERLVKLADDPKGLPAIQEILDRIDGKVADKLQLQGVMIVTTPEELDMVIRLKLADRERERLLGEADKGKLSGDGT